MTRKCSSAARSCPWTGCGAEAPTSPCGPCPASTTSTAGSRPCPGRRAISGPWTDPAAPTASCQRRPRVRDRDQVGDRGRALEVVEQDPGRLVDEGQALEGAEVEVDLEVGAGGGR